MASGNRIIYVISIVPNVFVKMYLKWRTKESRQRQRVKSPICFFTPQWPQWPCLGLEKVSLENPILVSHIGSRDPNPWVIIVAFLGVAAGSCIRKNL